VLVHPFRAFARIRDGYTARFQQKANRTANCSFYKYILYLSRPPTCNGKDRQKTSTPAPKEEEQP
jgi:hypothetical protein